jgi:hypothetical protein
MNRHLRYAMLVALGILLGVASSSFQQSKADPPAANGETTNAAILAELKEIKKQLKDANSFMRSGTFRTFGTLTPPPDPTPAENSQ